MELRRLPADEAAVRRYVEDLWLPYHRDLEAAVDAHALADRDEAAIVDEEVEFRLDRLDAEDYRAWVAVDGSPGDDAAIADVDADLVGFVTTSVDEAPPVFDRPDRLVVGDIYVHEDHRGTGLARELMERAARRAREVGCPELALDVDVDNGRAVAFYERLGFEPLRRRLVLPADGL